MPNSAPGAMGVSNLDRNNARPAVVTTLALLTSDLLRIAGIAGVPVPQLGRAIDRPSQQHRGDFGRPRPPWLDRGGLFDDRFRDDVGGPPWGGAGAPPHPGGGGWPP